MSDTTETDATNKTRLAAEGTTLVNEAQLVDLIERSTIRTKDALLEGLREVFSNEDTSQSPGKMSILVHRIPIICRDVLEIKSSVAATNKAVDKINDNLSRVVWIILTAVILAVLGLIIVK